ncbi:MAG: Eco57I restriction-modification methylase domain-containing protein, partial [Anaerolineae bacterium]|nr:Eco57I restriction-modification methylase domain-containing protein [Anaerolineae bacterium]
MSDLLQSIETHLNSPRLRDNLAPLFCETLLWGRPQASAFTREVTVRRQEKARLAFAPVAQLGGLPVFRVDWPYDKLPNVTQRRAVHRALAPTYIEHLLAYVTADDQQATFVWARRRARNKIEMRALPYAVGSPARTTIEQLGELAFTVEELGLFGEPPVTVVADKLNAAFDIEAVTRLFFTTYRNVFREAEGQISGISADARRLFTQKLLNRLMFLVFLERKGWLRFNGSRDYLHALWEDHRREKQANPDANFYRDRLDLLFFSGLNTPHEVNVVGIRRDGFLQTRIGDVPYLNGGLFEEDDEDRDPTIAVPDEAIEPALDKLFYRFNFTVTESTPMDVEVAVDPEMLGRIFEELVTGRHETGSYYTPKPVVAFMGREALKGYLQSVCSQESSKALTAFVDEHDPARLVNPEAVLDALKTVKVCDPACGSGAYLLGMLHELLELRACLFATRGLDPLTAYQRKLEIIQNNLYGVDLDPFAVNIARLRLWLSLVVDFEDGTPPPLPNLDFKIEIGDSLTAPDPSGGLQPDLFRHRQIEDYFRLKAGYLMAHGGEKLTLRERIEALRAEIAAWARPGGGDGGFDWAVEFAEVFAPSANGGYVGGFDIVLANPPYVRADVQYRHILDEEERQEAIARWQQYRKELKGSKIYKTLYEKWDLYIPFLERAYQLLRPGGQMVFIISDSYNAVKYARKSHEFFLANAHIVRLDFCSDIPLFKAGVSNTILHFARAKPDDAHIPLRFRRRGDKPDDFEDNVETLPAAPQARFGPVLFRPDGQKPMEIGEAFMPLERICYVSYGLRANADDRYWQGEFKTKDCLSSVKDKIHPKPFVQGKDLTKWTPQRIWYLEWGTVRAPRKFSRPTFPELHEAREKLIAVRTPGAVPKVIYDDGHLHFDASSVGFV